MYKLIETHCSNVVIIDQIINDVYPLLIAVNDSVNRQPNEANLLCWLVDVFHDDFEEYFGVYDDDTKLKLVLCILNAKHYLINDPVEFCEDFNGDDTPLDIGFDTAFYPVEKGRYYTLTDFAILSLDKKGAYYG